MQSLLATIIIPLLWVTRADDDNCRPMPPFLKGETRVHPRLCCDLKSMIPEVLYSSVRMCLHKFAMSNKTNNEAQMGVDYNETTIPSSKGERACLGECAFNESGLLTSDREVNKDAVHKLFNGVVASNKDAAPVMIAALNKCFPVYEDMIDEDLECTSGSEELRKCIFREIFLNCPESKWNASTECMELKNKHAKCPKLWIISPQATISQKSTNV